MQEVEMKRFLVVFLMMFLLVGTIWATGPKEEIVAEVGPYHLTKKEFEEMIAQAPPQIKLLLLRQPKLKENLLRRWSEITLLSLAAREEGLDKDPAVKIRIQQVVDKILAQEYLARKVLPQVKTSSEKEIQDFYQTHKKDYVEPEAIHARHILIEVPQKATKEQEAAALKKAEKIRERALKGEDFASLARKYSADIGTKDRGGDLGFFTRGQMIEEFEKAAFALKPGEVSKPIRTSFGYHIIKVEEKRPARQKSFQEVKDQIKEELLQKRQEEALAAALKELEKKHPIKIYLERVL